MSKNADASKPLPSEDNARGGAAAENYRTKTVHFEDAREESLERRFKLGKRIGSGGFGDVYRGMQISPVRREVAIKVARRKLDPKETREIVRRFKQEKQALALMNHEGIARFFDAGTSKDGQPFFVMELVRGLSISEFCEKHSLNLDRRLDLFLQVCKAVQHAHQKGVIHRDLKPANILVAGTPAEPVVKVIDFGIAKLVDPISAGIELTAVTQIGSTMGTYLYMSPEQADTNERDIDTRADVYSLGIILFELITGTTPLQFYLSSTGKSVEPVLWIKNEECVKPSDCIDILSKSPKTNADKLTRSLRISRRQIAGDLDLIVQGATEKDRDRRYGTLAEFSDDVQRYLQGEPIKRRPPSASYVVRKYFAKHKGYVVAALAVLASLLVGLLSTTIFWWMASKSNERLAEKNQEIQSVNERLTQTNKQNQSLIVQGSQIALARGRDAWNELKPQQAVSHFATALRMHSDNQQAQAWLYHALQSHSAQNWNPPYWILGGDVDTKKAVLSQDGRFAALQSKSSRRVTIVDVALQAIVRDSIELSGTIDDLFTDDGQKFMFLAVDEPNRQASVWQVLDRQVRQISVIRGEFIEGELEFSFSGDYLIKRIDQPVNKLIYRCADGQPVTYSVAGNVLPFYLSCDDALMLVKNADSQVPFYAVNFDNSVSPLDFPSFPVREIPEPAPAQGGVPLDSPSIPGREAGNFPVTISDPADDFTKPIAFGIAEASRGPAIKDGRIVERSNSRFVAGYPVGTSELLLTFLDLRAGTSELVKFSTGIAPEFIGDRTQSDRQFQLFPGIDNSFLAIEQPPGTGGCGPGVDCGKAPARISMYWRGKMVTHLKPPTIPVFSAVIDSQKPLAVLISRPIPSPELELFDFSSNETEPVRLALPSVDHISNDLETHFVGSRSHIVCRFAKNAIAVWNCPLETISTQHKVALETPRIDFTRVLNGIEWSQTNAGLLYTDSQSTQGQLPRQIKEFESSSQTLDAKQPFQKAKLVGRLLCFVSGKPSPPMLEIIDTQSVDSQIQLQLDESLAVSDVVIDTSGQFVAVVGLKRAERVPEPSLSTSNEEAAVSVLTTIEEYVPAFTVYDLRTKTEVI
jgi:serine/threonine protein kinase